MRRIVYDFAMTLDNFIGREDGSADGFLPDGGHLLDYQERLQKYDTVLMGRRTYEFGYQYGLEAGQRAYPHMDHYIFSRTLQLESDQVNVVSSEAIERVRQIQASKGGDIYLCGGGAFAGSLIQEELIDELVIKLNPIHFGKGIRPFGDTSKQLDLTLLECKPYENGVTLLRYKVNYDK